MFVSIEHRPGYCVGMPWRGHWEWALAVASIMVAVASESDKGDREPGMTVVLLEKRGQILVSLCSFPSPPIFLPSQRHFCLSSTPLPHTVIENQPQGARPECDFNITPLPNGIAAAQPAH